VIISTAAWGWPQWAMLSLEVGSVVASGVLHGRPKTGHYNVGIAFAGAAIGLFILVAGGFFR
jgi:hypothetical protein